MAITLLAGASGLIGGGLVSALDGAGESVRVLVRREPRAPHEVRWDPDAPSLPAGVLDGVGCVINLGGLPVGEGRLTRARKAAVVHSRVAGTALLARELAAQGDSRVRLLQASAVGFYGDSGDEVLTETHASGRSFLAGVCRAWERAAAPAVAAGVPVVFLRTGVVLDRSGGALARLMPFIRFRVAGSLGSGKQWWPWISLADEVRAILHLKDSALTGPVNISAPNPERNADVIRLLAAAVHRPARVPVPAFALRLGLGEFAEELLASQRMVPERLLADGFTFNHPHLEAAAPALMAT